MATDADAEYSELELSSPNSMYRNAPMVASRFDTDAALAKIVLSEQWLGTRTSSELEQLQLCCQSLLRQRERERDDSADAEGAIWTCEECGFQNEGTTEACEMCNEPQNRHGIAGGSGEPSRRMRWKWGGAIGSFLALGAATCTEPTSAAGGWFAMIVLGLIIFVQTPAEIGWKIAVEGWNWRQHAAPMGFNAVQVIFYAYCVSFSVAQFSHAAETSTTADDARVAHGRFPGGLPAGVNGDVVESMWIALFISILLRELKVAFTYPPLGETLRQLLRTLRPVISTVGALFLVIYVFGIIGCVWFTHPASEQQFGTAWDAWISLLAIANWDGFAETTETFGKEYGRSAEVFFVTFAILVSVLLVNVVLAVIVEAFQESAASPEQWGKGFYLRDTMQELLAGRKESERMLQRGRTAARH